jgi:hypothetical protein
VEWGAMMFLGLDDPQQLRRSRLKELALLLIRMATVALLAIALARPVLGRANMAAAAAVPPGSVHPAVSSPISCTVIVLDRSASMALEQNGPSRIDTARRAALSVLSSLRRGDEASVVLTPDFSWAQSQPPQASTDLQSLALRVSDTRPWNSHAEIATALRSAAIVLEQSHAPDKHIVLVCDRQASSWRDVTERFAQTWRESLRTPDGRSPRLTVIPIGTEQAGNVAIESVQIVNPPVVMNTSVEVEVHLRNFDTVPVAGVPLKVRLADDTLYETKVNLNAGASTVVQCVVKFSSTGPQLLTAELQWPGLDFDDRMDLALEVDPPIGVLVISGDEREGTQSDSSTSSVTSESSIPKFRNEADFVRLALAPHASAGRAGADPARVQVASAYDWPELDRRTHRVVILANVPRLSERQARQIEQFVYGGGGLLVAPGNLSRVDDYNSELWRDGAGMLPARLESPVAADGSQATALLGLDLAHPVHRFLRGRSDPVPPVTIGRYFPVRYSELTTRVLGQYASGQPFLVEGAYGRGRVLLMTTCLDADWSGLPFSSFYLPMMQSIVRYLAAGTSSEHNLSPGEPIVALIDAGDDAARGAPPRVTIDGPGIGSQPMELLPLGDGYEARHENTARPGRYTMRVGDGAAVRPIYFTVRPPREESDLTSLSPAQWLNLQQTLEFHSVSPDTESIEAAIVRMNRARELWPLLLGCVIALAIAEMALARLWTAPEAEPAPDSAALSLEVHGS